MTARKVVRPRPVEPLSEEEYLARCDCRCTRVRGTHPAGVCGAAEEILAQRAARQTAGG
ncbi:hypothetical protein [Amycolatopsis sp. GM8]|uniref:hypothetical protein n=1 Tax=Amycolatopsis sp. GM8 TaxID=2896530 RepID=UPI001F3A7278|nr:hypothetical protein [Amycolatopsis sp. GM8]